MSDSDTSIEETLTRARHSWAVESLIAELCGGKEGVVYFLTDGFYIKDYAKRGGISNQNIQTMPFKNGVDAFVAEALKDPNCRGLVPLTDSARRILTDEHGLRPIAIGIGIKLMPEQVQYDLYK